MFPSFILQLPSKLWWIVILSGFFETIYFNCLIEAYRTRDLSLVYPVSRSAPLFTQIWAISFIGEVLSKGGFIGIGLVMIGLFMISLKGFHLRNMISNPDHFISRSTFLALGAAMASPFTR